MCGALVCLLGGVCVGFGAGLCGRIDGVPVGAGCAPLVTDLFLFCYESVWIWMSGRPFGC